MTAPTHAEEERPAWRRFVPGKRFAIVVLIGLGLLVVLVAIGYATTTIPSPNSVVTSQTTTIYYADGRTEMASFGTNRVSVPLSLVPPKVQQTVLSAEDRNYYGEPGISFSGIARALYVDVAGGSVQQGGSTITQQYAKNAYLTQQRTFSRKLREIFIAVKLDQSKSKQEVLRDYLNTIYFGRGAYGIEAASRVYFGRHVQDLSVAQGAVLAALIRSPSALDPSLHPAANRSRWRYVIDGMVKKHWLTASEAAAVQYPKVLPIRHGIAKADPNGFVVQAVKDELAKHGFDEARLEQGGYKVVTTISRNAQNAAIAAESSGMPAGPVGALVSIDPKTGAIKALYGGAKFGDTKSKVGFIDEAFAPHQPGSSFKPYVLLTALKQNISLGSVFDGTSPLQGVPGYPPPKGLQNDSQNGVQEQCPYCTLLLATARSVNTVYVPLGIKVGVKNVRQTAWDAGIPKTEFGYRTLMDKQGYTGPSLALGTYPVTPLDQAVGYATIDNGGTRVSPFLVQRVDLRSGGNEYTAKVSKTKVLASDITADATYAMTQVLDNPAGTAFGKQLAGGRPAAGKTGTTSNNKDAWFVGYTPQLVTAVWVGNANGSPLKGIPGFANGVYGGTIPAQIWKSFMDVAHAGQPVLQFPPRANVGVVLNSPPPAPVTPSSSPTPSAKPTTKPKPTPKPKPSPPGKTTPPPPPADGTPTPAPATNPP